MKPLIIKATATFLGSLFVFYLFFNKELNSALLYSFVVTLAVLFYSLLVNKNK